MGHSIRLASNPAANFWPRFAGFAATYVLVAHLSQIWLSSDGVIGLFWPASGLALGVVLLGGQRYAAGVFLGQFLTSLLAGSTWSVALALASGNAVEVLLGAWLLAQSGRFDPRLRTMGDYLHLVLLAGLVAPAASALTGVGTLQLTGFLHRDNFLYHLSNWWLGNTLGISLVTPLILLWRLPTHSRHDTKTWRESAALLVLTFLSGQVIYFDWLGHYAIMALFPHDLTFILVIWAATRTGHRTVNAMLLMTALQMLIGAHLGRGYYAEDLPQTGPLNAWFHLMSLALVGMAIANYVGVRRRSDEDRRIAAIAFECQEGMIITDANMRILRTNQSFSRIMGYSNEEVLGQTTSFMRSDRHPAAFYEAAWAAAKREGAWHAEVWQRRKNGEVFPQWLTCTAVKDESGDITHFVVTHTDITHQKQQEAKRLAEEAAHRDALVREVHHRIKNNLQGITGLLRQFAQEHPEMTEVINQVKSQVRSIAVLHGLQGHTSMDTVRLCELTSAIAGDIQSVWQTPIDVDIPAIWRPGIIAEKEAVPIALVLNELLVNAVKHGGKAGGHVSVTLRKGQPEEAIQVSIRNPGHLRSNRDRSTTHHSGLQLVASLLPQTGVRLTREQQDNEVLTRLELEPPVIHLEETTQ